MKNFIRLFSILVLFFFTITQSNSAEKIDYLNIDVEGNEFNVISDFNFSKFQPKLISIEDNIYDIKETLNSSIHDLIANNGYFLASKYGKKSATGYYFFGSNLSQNLRRDITSLGQIWLKICDGTLLFWVKFGSKSATGHYFFGDITSLG